MIDSLRRNVQPVGEFGIGMPVHEQRQYLDLARRESCRILARRGTRPARNPAHAQLAQPLTHDSR